ncbi:Sal-like protein 1, partial [Stegodyphus mimosarum]
MNEVTPSSSSVPSVTDSQELICDLCGRQFSNQKALQQHLLSHAQPRPFVCEICDAGFTSSSSLIAHQSTHQNNS